MCLIIDKKVRNNHHKENGYCVGYKVLKWDDMSPYRQRLYQIGWENAQLGREENLQEVLYGLHLFLNKKDAITELEDWGKTFNRDEYKIIKVYYKPKDVIDYGIFRIGGWISTKTVAVKKLLVKSLKDIR